MFVQNIIRFGNHKTNYMKNKFTKILGVLSLALLLSSCAAFHSGSMEGSASLSSANFVYVKQNVRGYSQATYIFGIGGLAKETLVADAKIDLLRSNSLSSNQALANVSVNFKTSVYLGIVTTLGCTITADIVEFRR